jgi:hypothetical protein
VEIAAAYRLDPREVVEFDPELLATMVAVLTEDG